MTDQQYIVRCGDGTEARFSTPGIAADYARCRCASDRADAWLSVCAYVMIGLAIVGLLWRFA